MKKLLLLVTVALIFGSVACKKTSEEPKTPRTEIPGEIRGNWMYGNFSMTEYWSQDPASYVGGGNALEFVFAFAFNADGTYTQYFTSSNVTNGVRTYQQ